MTHPAPPRDGDPHTAPDERDIDLQALFRREVFELAGVAVASAAIPESQPGVTTVSGRQGPRTCTVEWTVNGELHVVELDPRQSILDVLRETLQLTGTKKGCNQGACGACTILLDGKRVNACLTLAIMHDRASITTIEGVARGERLHPLQAAFIEHEGFQCGFCTAGQILSGLGCIAEGHAGSPDEIRRWMSGNICRCGAYPGIVAAIADARGKDGS
jgi:xanthine dehydrogenase YagT iron-sulfur-binding subunit